MFVHNVFFLYIFIQILIKTDTRRLCINNFIQKRKYGFHYHAALLLTLSAIDKLCTIYNNTYIILSIYQSFLLFYIFNHLYKIYNT